jgi:predicted phage-related endonuclease
MLATIDRWQEKLRSDGDGSAIDTVPLELKTSNWSLDKDWKEEAPIAYQVQVQHQMAVTGSQSASIAALIGGQKFVWLDVARDEDFIQQLLALEMEFWGRLIANDPPPVDASEQTGKTLRRLFARAEEEIIALPTEAIEWDDRLGVVKTELKALQEEEQGLKNKLMFAIGNKTVGQLPNGVLYTFRLQKKAEYVVKASEGRVLRRKGAK